MSRRRVPHLESVNGVGELQAHYHEFNGNVTAGQDGFVVRLPHQKRIHFYIYDVARPIRMKAFTFKSEGYYDEHSPLRTGK